MSKQADSNSQKYGLILQKKGPLQPRLNVFQDDDDDDDEEKNENRKQKTVETNSNKSRSKVAEEDSSVYQYDEVYDDIQLQKDSSRKRKLEDTKPRYIQSLMKQAQRRKLEEERRVERKVQKEREAEGSEFKDKESFVTASYRKKVEEFSKLDAEDMKQEKLDELMDVTKRNDMSLFYKNLYDNITSDKSDKKETEDKNITDKDSKKEEKVEKITDDVPQQEKKARQYRKRRQSSSSSSSSSSTTSSSSSSSSEDEDQEKEMTADNKTKVQSPPKNEQLGPSTSRTVSRNPPSDLEDGEIVDPEDEEIKTEDQKSDSPEEVGEPETEKKSESQPETETSSSIQINIWEKRTVGELFEAALKRYMLRKSMKSAYLSQFVK